jgi:DNA-binding NarL/FixJ family response regulator
MPPQFHAADSLPIGLTAVLTGDAAAPPRLAADATLKITVAEGPSRSADGCRGLAVGGGATITDTVNLIVQQRPGQLTSRECEVRTLSTDGISGNGVARVLQASPNTVKSHSAVSMDKLNAACRAEAVAAVLRRAELRP